VTSSKPDLENAAVALNSGAIHLLRSLGAVDRQAGLTPARLSALSVLVFAGPCTLGALAAAEGVAGPTMTRIVDGLIAAGLAERQPSAVDRRAVSIAATASGDALMRAARRHRIDALAAAVGTLPAAAQRRLAASAGLLDQVAAAVRGQSAGGGGSGAGSGPGVGGGQGGLGAARRPGRARK
jgi:DNA-binding MarR family transcriptional regulator